jgi:hypothetical protein
MKTRTFFHKKNVCLLTLSFALAVSLAQAQAVKLVNRWKNETIGIANGKPVSTAAATDTWVIEKTGEGNFVRLKNATTGTYLHNQNGPLEAGLVECPMDNDARGWSFSPHQSLEKHLFAQSERPARIGSFGKCWLVECTVEICL